MNVTLAEFVEATGLADDDTLTDQAYAAWLASNEPFAEWWADNQAQFV